MQKCHNIKIFNNNNDDDGHFLIIFGNEHFKMLQMKSKEKTLNFTPKKYLFSALHGVLGVVKSSYQRKLIPSF